ncbi:carbohydrate ABC transporter permease [Brachybacterium phenoliresistens]|uniref:carbohydrate ABC transporter permease n=1 Tax=Brachybacterium phenoliresistens TaxID=396014 RepID=UPI0031DB52F9
MSAVSRDGATGPRAASDLRGEQDPRAVPEGPSPSRGATVPASDRIFAGVSHVVLVIWALIVVLPLLWTVISSFKDSLGILADPFALPTTWHVENFARAWTTAGIGRYFLNTVIVVGGALVLVMLLGAMCAYVLARFSFPGRSIIYFALVAGLTFPLFLAIVPLFFILQSMSLLGTYTGLILSYVAFALPFTVFFLFAFFRQLPDEIGEAAAIDGAGDFRTFFQIMLPMAKPGMVSVAIFNFLGLWNQYLIPVVLNTDKDKYVLAQGLANMQAQQGYQTDWSGMFASVTITIIPVLIVYVIFQRQLQGGVGPSTSK